MYAIDHQVPSVAANAAFTDVDGLFLAVQARIAQAFDQQFGRHEPPRVGEAAGDIRATVLACVGDIERLRSAVSAEIGQRRQLEQDIRDLQGRLGHLQAELSGSRASEIEARHLALHDHLTRLPNAAHFRARLGNELAQARTQPIAVLFVDLDRFKSINDKHGHDIGDAVLRVVAARLSGGTRAGDLASRYGGDEFACMLGGVASLRHLHGLVSKLALRLASPLTIGRLVLTVRASIGVAVFPVDGDTPDALLRNADIAMYVAKRQRSGFAFFQGSPRGPALPLK
jgi:diguanylate cyclase (GGDEF)-like protein